MKISDRLYGQIDVNGRELKLLQTRQIAHLRNLSLSVVPPAFVAASTCATKFEHSLGVAYLARLLADDFEEISFEIFCACLAHDCGTPPFSHTSEHLLYEVTGKNHEEFAIDVLQNSEFGDEVTKHGDFSLVLDLIIGKGTFGKLINGTIDLDNLDNSLRYGVSQGLIRGRLPYSPEKIARAFRFRGGKICLVNELDGLTQVINREILGWISCREQIYQFAYGPVNLAAGLMLFRALDFAFRAGDIRPSFFKLTEAEAILYLLKEAAWKSRRLIEKLNCWRFYRLAHNRVVDKSNLTHYLGSVRQLRGELADQLAKVLNVKDEEVIVYLGSGRTYKQIDLKLLGYNGEAIPLPQMKKSTDFVIQVYLDPDIVTEQVKNTVAGFVEEILQQKALLANAYY
ncbi:HD domain-containing protein [Candidatus Berkelbacteria bacterium]|nr:HD domain-containing protein [Candidatus Berkelbacteria bacterium]